MKLVFLRAFLISLVAAMGFVSFACDDDDDDIFSPAAPLEPAATATPTPGATATATPGATATPSPEASPTARPVGGNGGEPQTGDNVGFLGAIRFFDGTSMRVGNFFVDTNAETQFFRDGNAAAFDQFSVAENVRVAGIVTGPNTVLATKISLLPPE